jgi:cytochrome c oxidase assembly protein subunit 15
VVTLAIIALVRQLWREPSTPTALRWLGIGLLGLISLQIYLGAQIIWTGRSVSMTTGHVIIGALTLAVTFLLTCFTYHGSIKTNPA